MNFDLQEEIIQIVREAIEAGLINTTTIEEFEAYVATLQDEALEDYIQELWDNI